MSNALDTTIELYRETIDHPDTPEAIKIQFKKKLKELEALRNGREINLNDYIDDFYPEKPFTHRVSTCAICKEEFKYYDNRERDTCDNCWDDIEDDLIRHGHRYARNHWY